MGFMPLLGISFDISETWNSFVESMLKMMCNALKKSVTTNITGIMDSFYNNLDRINASLLETPQTFNAGIFNVIKNISDQAVLPLGVTILTFVVCYEILQMLIEKNRMAEIDMNQIFAIVFKMMIGLYVLNNCFNITMAFFDVGATVTRSVSDVVTDFTDVEEPEDAWKSVLESVSAMDETGENLVTLLVLLILTYVLKFAIFFMSMWILIITYSRFIEIYIYCSVSPLTLSTLINKEWGQIGMHYVRSLLALAFQAVFMMIIVGMYVGLISGFTMSYTGDGILYQVLGCVGSTIILVSSLSKTRDIARQVFNA